MTEREQLISDIAGFLTLILHGKNDVIFNRNKNKASTLHNEANRLIDKIQELFPEETNAILEARNNPEGV